MNLWRKVLCFSLLILILGSAFSAYSNANSNKLFQERKSANCAFLSFDSEDDINIDHQEIVAQSLPIYSFLSLWKISYPSFSSKSLITTSYLQLSVLRI